MSAKAITFRKNPSPERDPDRGKGSFSSSVAALVLVLSLTFVSIGLATCLLMGWNPSETFMFLLDSKSIDPKYNVKGTINANTGERMYQTYGLHFREINFTGSTTDIRWFCSEIEARAAGYARAMQ